MKNVPVRWSFKIEPIFCVLRIIGECEDIEIKESLIAQIVAWMNVATHIYTAIPITEPFHSPGISKLEVSCTLMFETVDDIEDFKDFIKSVE